jgi:hypothetical protein
VHKDLIVSGKCVHEAKQPIPGSGVDQSINAGKREAIFGAGLIEVGEIYAHSPFAVRFFHQDHIGQPFRVMNLFYELSLQELLNLHSYCFDPFGCKLPSLLLYWLGVRVYVQNMDDLLGINPRHIFV